jgi:erythromycin esterase
MGFTAIAVESGFTESEAVQRYVAGGPGNLSDIVRNGISWGFGEFGENADLIAWMRAYNANPTHTRKLRFYGIDLSGAGNGAFPNARRAVDAALASLRLHDAPVADSLQAQLNPLLGRFSSDAYASLSSAERRRLTAALTTLGNALVADGRMPRSTDTDQSDAWSVQNVRVAEQLRRMLEVYPAPGPSPGIPPEAFRAEAVRNSGMAENVRWALQLEGSAGRVLVFAHNNHVMNSTITGGPWSAFRVPPPAMGKFLRSALGDQLRLVGSASSVAQPKNHADSTSLDLALQRILQSSFVLDLRPARTRPDILDWLSRSRPLHSNGSDYVILRPISAFDAIVFIDTLTSARRLASMPH